MEIEERLKQKIKKEEKFSIIIGVVICAVLCALITVAVVNRVIYIKNENTETATWLNFGIIALLIGFVAVFLKSILFVYIDSKKENYENITIVVLKVRTSMNLLYGTWKSEALVENLETG